MKKGLQDAIEVSSDNDFLIILNQYMDDHPNELFETVEDAEHILDLAFTIAYSDIIMDCIVDEAATRWEGKPLQERKDVEKNPELMNPKHINALEKVFTRLEQSCDAGKFTRDEFARRESFILKYEMTLKHRFRFTKLFSMICLFYPSIGIVYENQLMKQKQLHRLSLLFQNKRGVKPKGSEQSSSWFSLCQLY